MRYSKQRKQDTRRRILVSARTLFTTKGFDATSIDEIMRAGTLLEHADAFVRPTFFWTPSVRSSNAA